MDFAKKWQQRSPLIRHLARWQESPAYPVVYALLCAIAGLNGKQVYLPILGVLTLFIIFSALFVEDKKVFLPPMFMVFCALGCDNIEFARGGFRTLLIGVFDLDAMVLFCLIGVVMLTALLARFFKEGSFLDALKDRSAFIYGLLAISIALMLNGTLSQTWRPSNVVFGLLFAFGFLFFYCLTYSLLQNSKGATEYACICMVCTALLVVLQIAVTMLRLHEQGLLIRYYETLPPRLRRENIQLAWGYATNIAGITILGVPAAAYLARNRRRPILYCLLALLFWGATLAVGTRSAFLVGGTVLAFCLLLLCLNGKNVKRVRLFTLTLIVGAVAAVIYVDKNVYSLRQTFAEMLNFLRLNNLKELDRLPFWLNGWQDFIRAPFFGVGFYDGVTDVKIETSNVFADMYHNVIFEFLGAMGLCGILAFLWHIKDLAKCLFGRFSINKLLLMLLPLTVLATSLADNFFFYTNFQILYCAFLVLAEREANAEKAQQADK